MPRTEEQRLRKAAYERMRYQRPEVRERIKKFSDATRKKCRYGITQGMFDGMLAEQEGRCAICNRTMAPPCIDHDHASGRVRGLLCRNCNWVLGNAGDSIEVLQSAINYLGGS